MEKSNISDMKNMVERVEERALKEIYKNNGFIDLVERIFMDPYADVYPADSWLWLELFAMAAKITDDLQVRLFFMRGGGTILLQNNKFGYVLSPIIGNNGWESMELYNKEKQCLNLYKAQIIELLKELSKIKN